MDTGNPDKKELSNTESGGNKDMVTMVSEPVQASTSEMVPFHVDTGMIPQASLEEQASAELKHLGLDVFNQNEFEQGVISQVDKALAIEEQNRLVKILQKELKSVNEYYSAARKEFVHINKLLESFEDNASSVGEKTYSAVWRQKDNKQKQLKKLKARCRFLQTKLHAVLSDDSRTDDKEDRDNTDHIASLLFKPNEESEKELEKDRLIRLGEMTPFGTVIKTKENETTPVQKKQIQLATPETSDFDKFLSEKDLLLSAVKKKCVKKPQTLTNHLPENNISKSGFRRRSLEAEDNIYSNKKTHQTNLIDIDDIKLHSWERDNEQKQDNLKHRLNSTENGKLSEDVTSDNEKHIPHHFKPENDYDSYEDVDKCVVKKKREPPPYTDDDYVPSYKKRKKNNLGPKKAKDDGDERFYRKRLKKEQDCFDSDVEDEHFEGGLKVPGVIWNNLYKYQKTGVRWLWELHCQESGGIVGDEMGLGKTIQMIVFFAALKCSKLQSKSLPYTGLGPCIIVCPTTVMHQWVREFHKWWPPFRVAILHSSGSHTGKVSELVRTIVKSHGILVTSYNTLVLHQDTVLHYNWHYVVLDEGHKIRNPDAQVTLACKQFRTPHRIILSGSPIQNNLKELWSLFDFVFPGKLGMLPDFLEHFSIPIVQGGYANATQIQVETSYKCVCVLRDTINPYLLRRMKADVQSNINLPAKSEQVLFCRLTEEQQAVYQDYLDSRECQNILAGKYKVFAGLITLRKICNHPDLSTGGPRIFVGQSTEGDETLEYGYWRRSGKLIVVEALLRLWKKQGHRILLFTQSRMMLEILESFLIKHNYNYIKMDGTTPVSSRQPLVSRFNQDTSLDVFLLTTRVGGLGVNLTGANRIIIFDPDWNPSTDMQARERAWRIGQTKPVTIYRLLTSGTIEEKIYHRQIFKQFLTNRVLKDPKQRRFFKSNDIFELFTLNNKGDGEGTETSAIFAGMGADIKMPKKKKNRFDEIKRIKNLKTEDEYEASLDEDELARMRALARKLSKQIGEGKLRRSNESTNKEHVNNTTVGNTTNTHSGKDHTHNSSHTVNGKSFKNESISENDGNYRAFGDKKKKVKDARFEGERIPYLAKHKTMKCPANKEDPQKKSVQQDDYVLRALFKGTGIQGALKHDKIMESSQPDYALVEAEAEKVAKQAAIALKRSRTQCFSAVSGIPTWTGRHGGPSTRLRFGKKKNSQLLGQTEKLKTETSSGNTKEPKLFDGSISGSAVLASTTSNVMSSDELLHKMRERHTLSTTQQSEGDPLDLLKSEDMELMTDIRNFVALEAAINGQATTQELLEHFKTKIPNNGSAKFRAMLYQICDLEKKDGIGTWRLKFEFR